MTDKTVLQQRLSEAESVYHNIAINGGVRVLVDQSGERIEFSPTNLSRLKSYILDLKSQLGILPSTGGPLGFWF